MSTDPVKEKIQSLCPDVMELREGCEVLVGTDKLKHTIYGYEADERTYMAYLNKPFRKDLQANSFYDCEFGADADFEILGSPITLAVVLRAIQKGAKYPTLVEYWLGKIQGEFIIKNDDAESVVWKLWQDNYDDQDEPMKAFIGSLILN